MLATKIAFYIIQLFEGMGIGSFFPIYSPWLELHGLNFLKMGFVNFVYHIASVMLDPFTGFIADKFGKRESFIVGQVLWTSTQYLYGLSTNMGGFLVAECVAAIGGSFKSDALESWLQNKLGNDEASKTMSSARVLFTTGQISTSILSGYISATYGMKVSWMVSGTCFLTATLIAVICLYLAGSDIQKSDTQSVQKSEVSLKEIFTLALTNKKILMSGLLVGLYGTVSKPVFMYWPQILTGFGMEEEHLGWAILAMSLPSLLGNLLAGRKIIFASTVVGMSRMYILTFFGLAGIALAKNVYAFLFALVLVEIAYGSTKITKFGLVAEETTDQNRATVNSLMSAAGMLGGAVSLLVMGGIADVLSPQGSIAVGACLILLAILYLSWQRIKLVFKHLLLMFG